MRTDPAPRECTGWHFCRGYLKGGRGDCDAVRTPGLSNLGKATKENKCKKDIRSHRWHYAWEGMREEYQAGQSRLEGAKDDH